MTIEDYLKDRLDNQIDWYNRKSAINKKRYNTLRFSIILISVCIPFLTGLITDGTTWLKMAVGFGGVLIALFEGASTLYKFQENWLTYRMTSEQLQREKLFFLTKSGPYQKNHSLQMLVARAEAIMSSENETWVKTQAQVNEEEAAEEEETTA